MKIDTFALFMSMMLILMSFMPVGVVAIEKQPIGQVELIQGEVKAKQPDGEQRHLHGHSLIYEGDIIETIGAGAVVIMMSNGTQWEIFDESIFENLT